MPKARIRPEASATSKADAMALLEEAEAEAAEAEALAAAARARARAARLRREVQARTEAEAAKAAEAEAAEVEEVEEAEPEDAEAAEAEGSDEQAPDADQDADDVDDIDESDSDTEETDDSDTEETDEETVEAAAPESRLAGWRRRLPSLSATYKVVAIILICAFVGAIGHMLWYVRQADERQQRAANFVAGARQGVVNMTSMDFNRAKEDVQRVLDSSTGEFKDDFQQRAKDFVSVVERSKVVTQGSINATAIESMGEHSASVLVVATSRITNAAGAKDDARAWRFRVTVTEEGGQYKMSKLEFAP